MDLPRIYGTSGQSFVTLPGQPEWTNAVGVNGDQSGDKNPAQIVLAAQFGNTLALSIPATAVPGQLIGMRLGFRAAAAVGPASGAALYMTIGDGGAGWELNGSAQTIAAGGGFADYELLLSSISTGTWPQVQAAIEAGVAFSASPTRGMFVGGASLAGASTFQVSEAWIKPIVQDGGLGEVGSKSSYTTLRVDSPATPPDPLLDGIMYVVYNADVIESVHFNSPVDGHHITLLAASGYQMVHAGNRVTIINKACLEDDAAAYWIRGGRIFWCAR